MVDELFDVEPPFDAPLADKRLFDASLGDLTLGETGPEGLETPTTRVDLPGQAATGAVGDRKPKAGQHNWIPTGPRNVGGRVRALIIDPQDPNVLYAGAASGGVHKTVDGGETWFPLWHEQPSLAIGALAIFRTAGQAGRIWAATGEPSKGGGKGIFRSDNDGADWVVTGAVPADQFDAIAVHPTDRDRSVAVGPSGIFRTSNGGTSWIQFAAGTYYSDVAYSVDAAGHPILYLVRAVSTAGEAAVLRIDLPDAADAAFRAALALAANASLVIPTPAAVPADKPKRGKIGICRGQPDVAFVRFATENGTKRSGKDADGVHAGIFRAQNARAAPPNTIHWDRLQDNADWNRESQGNYNLSVAVNPTNPNVVATGMTELYIARDANTAAPGAVTFDRIMAWELYAVDRAHHADNHAALFARQVPGEPPDTLELWVANDGGISRSADWFHSTVSYGRSGSMTLPLGPGLTTWRKRSHGIGAAQMYSLGQSPLVPTMYGCGLQDNGVYVSTGGQTWHWVLDGDGGSVAFDPDDPFTLVANWQEEIHEILFPGRAEERLPAPGDDLPRAVFPRPLRQGFLPSDGGVFAGKAVHHPLQGGRVLHAREHRLYGTRRLAGDAWEPLPVGRGLELLYDSGTATSTLEVLPGPAARRLGLAAQVAFAQATPSLFAQPVPAVARVRSLFPAPYSVVAGETLDLRLNGAVVHIALAAAPGLDLNSLSVTQLARLLAGRAPGLSAHPCFWPGPTMVEITTKGVGADAQITVGGNALDPMPGKTLGRLFVQPGTYKGEADRPASVTLVADGADVGPLANGDNRKLTITIGPAGVQKGVEISKPPFANRHSIRSGELATAIKAALGDDAATVSTTRVLKSLRFRLRADAAAGAQVAIGDTGAPRLNLTAPAAPVVWQRAKPVKSALTVFDLSVRPPAAALRLTIGDGTNATPPLVLALPQVDVAHLEAVTVEELRRVLAAHLAGTPAVTVTCDLELEPEPGHPSEMAYAPGAPNVVWAGGQDGMLFRSEDDGASWQPIAQPQLQRMAREVTAIAIDPRDARRVYVGLVGAAIGSDDPGFLFRTENAGESWSHVGGGLADGDFLLPVNSLQLDPEDPDTVYAATRLGVFRSRNRGGDWQSFNEGLPNTVAVALAFVPATRTLRVGAYGRGTFERHVGDRPPKDVHLYVRASLLDDGAARPALRGPSATAAVPGEEPQIESPDIKVNRVRPPGIGADELIDGVEFDEDFAHEEPRFGPAGVFVQVHNRGSFEATGVRITALWADAANGPPPLAADFWQTYRAGGALPAALGDWHTIGDTTLAPDGRGHERIVVGYPRVHHFDVDWPAALDELRRIGILLLVSCPTDPLGTVERDVAALLAQEPKVAYRETRTTPAVYEGTLFIRRTGPAQFSIADAPAPHVSALAALGLTAGGPFNEILGGTRSGVVTFALPPAGGGPGSNPAITFTVAQHIDITLRPDEFVMPARVQARELIAFLNRELTRNGILVRARDIVLPPAPVAGSIALRRTGNATFSVGGTAATMLGIPAGPVAPGAFASATAREPFNLTAGAPLVLTLDVSNTATIEFQPGAATARAVREVLNRGFAAAALPVEAIVPRVDLWVRRSITDVDGVPTPVGSRRLADLAAEPAAVAAGADRAALFDLLRVLRDDTIRPSVDNFLYLRSANLGVAAQADTRHRLFQLAIAATPITATPIATPVTERLPAGGTAIVEFTWNPGAAAAGDRLFVLAVADHDSDGRRLDPPASFPTLDALDAFCDTHPNAAYREFTVAT